MTRSALVVHSDQKQLRFACDALVMFNPGYRVSTATDVETASDWLGMLTPDLVVLEASITDPDALRGWAKQHSLDPDRTILFGRATPAVDDLGCASFGEEGVDGPIKLPDFMAAVRTIANRSSSYTPMATEPVKQGRR